MAFLKKTVPLKNGLSTRIFFAGEGEAERHCLENFPSKSLDRPVRIDLFLPPAYYDQPGLSYPLLLLNDGQDLEAVRLEDTLRRLYRQRLLRPIIAAGVHAGDRMQEYGTAGRPDYQKRGSKAGAYTRFIRQELMPALHQRYRILSTPATTAFAGFSLGGLSALDIAWKNPDLFGKAGVFSGSLWWRSKAFQAEAPDANRIMHDIISRSKQRPELKFWFQTGTKDETEDRNNNGVIDSIDDTLDLIGELKKLGYRDGRDIKYVEVIDGEHNPLTWARVMPVFLRWAFGNGG